MAYEEVRRSAERLLRGEHCLVLEIQRKDDGDAFVPVAGDAQRGFRASIVRRALEAGRAVAGDEDAANDADRGTTATRATAGSSRSARRFAPDFRPRPCGRLPLRGALPGPRPVRSGRRAAGQLHRHHCRRRLGKRRRLPAVAGPQRHPGAARGRPHRRRRVARTGACPLQSRARATGQRASRRPRSNCAWPRRPPSRPTAPRANSWP